MPPRASAKCLEHVVQTLSQHAEVAVVHAPGVQLLGELSKQPRPGAAFGSNGHLERLRAGRSWIETGIVFASTIGTPLEPRNLNRLFDELIVKAEVRRIRFHDLRHTSASIMLAQGVQPRVVMEVLGHSQLSMTTDLYGHVMPAALRDAADAVDRVLG